MQVFRGRIAILLAMWCAALVTPTVALMPQPLMIHLLNVGQGDAILIRTPRNRTILVDGGPDRRVLRALDAITPLGARRIDLVVLTHPHADHFEGLVAVLGEWRIGRVLLTGAAMKTTGFQALLSTLIERDVPISFVAAPMSGSIDGVAMRILAPRERLIGATKGNANDGSVVLELEYGSTRHLLVGDLEARGERALLAAGNARHTTTLKVGHHGSNTSSSAAFVRAVEPDIALVSVGAKNTYRHPHPDALARLEAAGARVFRTDTLGTVSVACARMCCEVGAQIPVIRTWRTPRCPRP